MTTQSPITDIHAAEKAAKKKIEAAKSENILKIAETRNKEEEKLAQLENDLRTKGREKILTAKKEAAISADEKLKKGKANDESMIKVARDKSKNATDEGVKTFKEHIKA